MAGDKLKKLLAPDEDFYRIMVESIEPEQSFFQVFWASASHPGQAIESVLSACVHLGIRNPIATELDYLDLSSVSDDGSHEVWANVFSLQDRFYFPSEKSFTAPVGIIGSSEKGEHDHEQIREGFALTKTEDIYELEAVIDRDNLWNTFFELMKSLPSIKVFWIRIAFDWEDYGMHQLWTNEDLNTVEAITSFLNTHWADTVANGHVALTVYSEDGQTNLTLDTHKTIVVLTKSAKMRRRMATGLRRLGFAKLSEFLSLKYNYHHWHYRPSQSKSRTDLVALLERNGFTLWREEEPEGEE